MTLPAYDLNEHHIETLAHGLRCAERAMHHPLTTDLSEYYEAIKLLDALDLLTDEEEKEDG